MRFCEKSRVGKGRGRAHGFDTADHKCRGEDGHVEVVEVFDLTHLQHRLGKAVWHWESGVEAAVDVVDEAAVGIDEAFVEAFAAD